VNQCQIFFLLCFKSRESRKLPCFACASVTNFSMNYELPTTNSPRDQMREGVLQSLSKTRHFPAIFAQKARIFANFCKFLAIFLIFFHQLARFIRLRRIDAKILSALGGFILPNLPNRYRLLRFPLEAVGRIPCLNCRIFPIYTLMVYHL